MPGIYRNRERDRRFIRPSDELPGYQHAQWEDVTEPVTGGEYPRGYIAAGIQPQAAAAAIPQLPPPMAAPMPREARREPPREAGPITDEWEDVSYIEEAPTMPGRVAERWELGQMNVELGLLQSQVLMGDTSPDIQDRIAEIKAIMPRGERRKHTFAERMAAESAEMAPTMASGIKAGMKRGLILGGGAAAITAVAGGPTGPITVPIAAAGGYTVGMTSAMLENIGRIEAGLAYDEFLDVKDPKTGQKIDPTVARWAALGVGSVNALLELFQIKLLMKAIPGGKTLLRAATNGAVKKVITGTPLKRLAFRASKYTGVVGAETLQEIAQEASTITGQAVATELTNRIKGTKIAHQTKEEILTRLKDTAESSMYAFSLMALPHAGGVRARATEPTETVPTEHAPVDVTAAPKEKSEHRRILDKVKADVEGGAIDIEQIEGIRDLYRQRFPDKLPEIQELENLVIKMGQVEAPEIREGVAPVAVTGELARKPAEEIAEPVTGAIETEEATRQSQEGFDLVQQQLAEEEAIQAAAEQEAVAPIPYEEVYAEEVEPTAPEAIAPEIEEPVRAPEEVPPTEAPIIPAEEVPTTAAELVDQAAAEAETEPTEAQKESGIYKKGHVKLHGLDISIENPIGSVRRGVADGKAWATTMRHHYGYFPGFEGKDKDHVDVFIGPNPESERMFVVDQINPKTKTFDEHKVMMGFDTEKQARVAYMSNYEKGWKGLGNITSMNMDEFKNWLKTADKKKRAAEISKIEVGEYVYHGTSEGAFRQIRKTGLTGKTNYFSKDELYARTYAERKGVLKEPRILRIKKTADIIPDERIPEVGDLKTKRTISPKEIEVKVGKEWIPIQEYYDESINIMPLEPEIPPRKPALVPTLAEKPKKVVIPAPKKKKARKERLEKKPAKKEAAKKLALNISNILKDERGSISFKKLTSQYPSVYDNLLTTSKDLINQGYRNFATFRDKMKTTFADAWSKIKNTMFRLFLDAKGKLKEETGAIIIKGRKEKEIPTLKVAEKKEGWAEAYFEKITKGKEISREELARGIKRPKTRIRILTGQTKIGDFIQEEVALKAAMKKAAQAARLAYREATREATAKEKAKGKIALEALRKNKLAAFAKEKARVKELAIRAKERTKIRTAIKKIVKNLKAIDVEKMSPQEAEPIRDLLANIDLVRMNKKTKLRLTRTKEYLDKNPDTELADHVLERLSRLDKQNLNDISFDELHSIYTAVMHYAHLNKVKNKIKVGRERKRAAEVLDNSIAEMKPIKKVETDIITSQPGGFKGIRKVGRLLKDTFGIRHDHFDLIIESLSGTNSIMDKVLYQGVKEGITKQLKYKQDVYSQFNEDLGNFDERYKIDNIATWLEEAVRTGRFNLTRGERMALYRHSFNADNRRAVVEGGFGFKASSTPNKVHRMTEAELEEILKSLSPAEKAFAGKPVTNFYENNAKELDKVFYEKNGYPMPKEENYYPKEVMPLTRGKDIEKEEALERFKGKWARIGLEKGMLEKRKRVKNPIYLNSISYDLNKSVMKSAAYVGLELPLSNASKLLYNRNFRRELTNRYGTQTWKEIEKGLRDIAGDWQSYTTTEELLLKTKNNLSVAFLGVNPFVMAKQVLSFSVYLPYIKPLYLMQGMLDYISHPMELKERHKMYSPEYLERVEGGYSRDVADIFKKGAEKRLYAGKKTIKEKFMGGIKLFDSAAVTPGMQGAVLQVLDEFSQGKLSREVKIALDMKDSDIARLTAQDRMRLAYKFADYATERTQPMFSPEHRSSLSRGASVEKLGTMFGSFTNQALNLMRRSYREGRRTKDPAAYKKFAQSLFVIMVLNTLGVMVIDDIRDRLYGRKREGIIYGILDTWSGYMFFVRDLASSVISKVERGTFMGYDVEWPIGRVPELLSNVIANGVGVITETGEKRKKKAARFIDDSLDLVLMMNGIPYKTPKRLAGVGAELIQYGALPIKKKVATEQFVEEWVKAKKARDWARFRELKLKVDDYNKIQRRKGKKGEPIKWTSIAQKGINIMKAEVKAQKLARR